MTCITTIEKQLAKVIEYSQSIPQANPHALVEKWYDAKRKFIEGWNGYIYECKGPVTFYLSPEEKKHRFNEYIDVVDNTYGNFSLTEFLDWLDIEEVFDNHTSRDYWLTDTDKIPKGTKISKAFKYFETNESVLRKLQDQLSTILQEDKITGTLCLSVHPLDFMSVSENTYHWRSCHALDGDYRAGNLQYMVDSCTVVCYLRGTQEAKLPNFPEDVPWNSKKWRMLLFVSDLQNAMFAGRQYPFFSPSAMDCVQEAYLNSMNKRVRAWTPWYNDCIKRFPRKDGETEILNSDCDVLLCQRYIAIGGRVLGMRDAIKECKKPLFFNDLIDSSCYIPYYSWNRYMDADVQFHIGGEVPCPICGKHPLHEPETLMCRECLNSAHEITDHYVYCECCDCRLHVHEGFYVEGTGQVLCENCFDETTSSCDRCNRRWPTYEIQYDRETEQHLCPTCRRRGIESSEYDWFDDDLPF